MVYIEQTRLFFNDEDDILKSINGVDLPEEVYISKGDKIYLYFDREDNKARVLKFSVLTED